MDSYEDRYTYSFAFAATASSIVQVILDSDFTSVFGEDFQDAQKESPSYIVGMQIFQRILLSLPKMCMFEIIFHI